MSEEKMKILKMLEEGKITAEEAARLLEAIEIPEERAEQDSVSNIEKAAGSKKKFLRILVYEDGNFEKPKVRVNIPLQLARFAMKFIPKGEGIARVNGKEIPIGELDIDKLIDLASKIDDGKLIEVDDGPERVIISLV